jgi:hypothetical protein
MDSRAIKQFIYGSIFIGIFILIIAGIYFLFFSTGPTCFDKIQNQDELGIDCGGVCSLSCEQKNAQPLEVSYVKKVKNGNNKAVLLAEIKNSNFEFGASSFEYSFDISDIDGNKVKSISGQSFIYPGETKYLFEIIDADNIYTTQDLTLSQYIWKSKDEFQKPNIQIKEHKTEINSKDSIYPLVVSGVIKNIDIISVSKAIISAFVYDNMGTIIGVSKTELENIRPTDERNFTIVFPKDINISLINQNTTRVYVDAVK